MSTSVVLGQLRKVDIREIWTNEAHNFTPWLAEESNIELLGNTINLDLEVESQEKDVGPFRADILCKDMATGNWVLIENQLERTDHCHLGQLITYAAGLKAATIVWIASRFTDEHRAALDWLNEITNGDFNFFGLEVEVWRIGESAAAPKFNIVSAPNNWTQTVANVKKTVEQGQLSGVKQLQLDFWTSFREYVLDCDTEIKIPKALPQAWMSTAIGRTGFSLVVVASTYDAEAGTPDQHLRVELVMINDADKAYFAQLENAKAVIEAEFGGALTWAESIGKKQSKVYVRRSANFDDVSQWPEYHEWLLKNLESFHRLFAKRVKEFVSPAMTSI